MAEPLCSYFGSCGGCAAQNVDYPLQVENKRNALAGAIGFEDIRVFHGEEYFYRTRVDMVFHQGGLGFRRKGSWHRIVDVGQCVIAGKAVNRLVGEVRDFFADVDNFHVKKKSGTFRYAVIRAPGGDSSISFVLNADSTRLLQAREKIIEFAEGCAAKNIVVTYVPNNRDASVSGDYFTIKGTDELAVKILGHDFSFNVQGFFQNNDRMALELHTYVRGILKSHEPGTPHLADLYGGVGTFGIINSDLFGKVTVIESFPQAVDSARKNVIANGCQNVTVLELDAKRLKNASLPQPLTVITDPPRSGMNPKTIVELNRLHPQLIVYVSCNIRQLGADVQKFKGYSVKSAAMFDFFPHTPHVEAVVELAADELI